MLNTSQLVRSLCTEVVGVLFFIFKMLVLLISLYFSSSCILISSDYVLYLVIILVAMWGWNQLSHHHNFVLAPWCTTPSVTYILSTCGTCLTTSADITVSQELSVCETDSIPTIFTITCTDLDSTSSRSLIWLVTGLKNMMSRTLIPGFQTLFFTYPFPTRTGEATLMVNDTMNIHVVEGTCFQCRDPNDANTASTAVCVTVTCE